MFTRYIKNIFIFHSYNKIEFFELIFLVISVINYSVFGDAIFSKMSRDRMNIDEKKEFEYLTIQYTLK